MKLTQLHVKTSDVRLTGQASPLHFSWKVTESTGIKQVWARICIHQGEKTLFDSGVDAQANSEDYAVNFLPELCGT